MQPFAREGPATGGVRKGNDGEAKDDDQDGREDEGDEAYHREGDGVGVEGVGDVRVVEGEDAFGAGEE